MCYISQWSYHVFALFVPWIHWNHMQNHSFPNAYTVIYIAHAHVCMVFISLWSTHSIDTSKWIELTYCSLLCIIHIHVVHMFQILHWMHMIHTLDMFRLVHIVHMLHMVCIGHVVHMLIMGACDTYVPIGTYDTYVTYVPVHNVHKLHMVHTGRVVHMVRMVYMGYVVT